MLWYVVALLPLNYCFAMNLQFPITCDTVRCPVNWRQQYLFPDVIRYWGGHGRNDHLNERAHHYNSSLASLDENVPILMHMQAGHYHGNSQCY